jgi:hypothetical protein
MLRRDVLQSIRRIIARPRSDWVSFGGEARNGHRDPRVKPNDMCGIPSAPLARLSPPESALRGLGT